MIERHMQRALNHQAIRWVAALSVFWVGGTILLFSPSRIEYPAPIILIHLSTIFDSLLMAMIFYSAIGLIVGKRVAWRVAIIILTSSVIWETVESRTTVSLYSLFPLLALGIVVLSRHHYQLRSEPSGIAAALRRALLFTSFSTILACIGFLLFAHQEHRAFSLLPSILEVIRHMYNLQDIFEPIRHASPSHLIGRSLLFTLGLANYLLIALALAKPVIDRFHLTPHTHQRVWRLLSRYAHDSEDYFKYWPADKSYYFGRRTVGFIAYGVQQNTCIALADPIGINPSRLIHEFDYFCRTKGWNAVFLPVHESQCALYEQLGYTSIKIGESAVVDLAEFAATTRHTKNFRNIVNRFYKQGYTTRFLSKPYDNDTLQAISDQWLAKGRQERQFAMGYFDTAYIQASRIFGLFDTNDKLVAWVNLQPNFSSQKASFDLMRSSNDAAPNAIDYLLVNLISALRDEGYKKLDFGLAPLSGLSKERSDERNLHLVYQHANRLFAFKGLRRFKEKFRPDWHSYYLIQKLDTSPHLAATALALNSLTKHKADTPAVVKQTRHPRTLKQQAQ